MTNKHASIEQSMAVGSQIIKGEELNKTVMKVFEQEEHLLVIARAFTGHHQIAWEIIQHNGNNNYLVKRGGTLFGVWRSYIMDVEGYGVIPVRLIIEESETTQAQLLNEWTSWGLTFVIPERKH